MQVRDIVHFEQAHFFEGAVQLRWLTERTHQAQQAAEAFVFHGPRYHAAGDAEADGFDRQYRLKDTASFISDLLASLQAGLRGEEQNPYWLVIAGYGAGKSHLALTCATLLSQPHTELSSVITQHLKQADTELGLKVESYLQQLSKPALVLTLDGMAGFHLGNALTQAALTQLKLQGIDTGAITALSPRFQTAEQFVERNFSLRVDEFAKQLPSCSKEHILVGLQGQDEAIYSVVDLIYSQANGSPIPLVGQESAQALLDTLCEIYCGSEGPFSSVVILFDEFGRYLEYAAEKPLLAGDSALQQIFQGVQDNNQKIRFIGFIQYELKAYLQRFGSSDLRQLQRYITRFDTAQKWYLSTNLETLFAHMIGKQKEQLEILWQSTKATLYTDRTRQLLQYSLPGYQHLPVWNDAASFNRVIAQGCWPLHPLATWFLTRQKDVVQSRSALTFIKEALERSANLPIIAAEQRLYQVSAADLILEGLLPEMIAAERHTGGVVAETLQTLLEKFQAHLTSQQRRVLAGVAVLERMRLSRLAQSQMNDLLTEACLINQAELNQSLNYLSQELGALEWNKDLGQYELIIDASTRGQFQQWLRQQTLQAGKLEQGQLFLKYINSDAGLETLLPAPDFAQAHHISTNDWQFKSHLACSANLKAIIERAFKEWQAASLPTDAKGQVIYLYLASADAVDQIESQIQTIFQEQLALAKTRQAPIWVIGINDANSSIAEHLTRLYIFRERIGANDKERFSRFLPDETKRSQDALKEWIAHAIKERLFWIAGFETVPSGRLKQVANSIFTTVYPQTLPFPFDGFTTSHGNGSNDIGTLTRALAAKQVSAAWCNTQVPRLKNRTLELLTQSWGCFRTQSSLLMEPLQPQVKAVYDQLIHLHQNPAHTLWQSQQLLLAPPYGLNVASAGLLLGLLIGLETPPRRLIHQKELVATTDWISSAFPTQKGAHYFSVETLKHTTLRFLDMNAEGRWRDLLNRWESAQDYTNIIRIASEVEKQFNSEPLPENLTNLYLHLKERSNGIEQKVIDTKLNLDKLETQLEAALRKQEVGLLLVSAQELLKLKNMFELDPVWPAQLIEPNQRLFQHAYDTLTPLLSAWIPRQTCNAVAQLDQYRHRISKAVRTLQALKLNTYASQLEAQAQKNIATIEQRQKFSLLLDRSHEYPQQPTPNSSSRVRYLQDEIQQGNELIQGLQQASAVLNPAELEQRTQEIKRYQQLLKEQINKHKASLATLYNQAPTSQQTLAERLVQLKNWQMIFLDTPDAQEVQDLLTQLELIQQDSQIWESDTNISPERLEEILTAQIDTQYHTLLTTLNAQDIECAWDLKIIYQALVAERIAAAYKRSQEWIAARLLAPEKLITLSLTRCTELERELQQAPAYLTHHDKQACTMLSKQVQNQIAEFKEAQRVQGIKVWLKNLDRIPIPEQLSQAELEYWLRLIQSPPFILTVNEQVIVKPLEEKLLTRIDQLSLDDIMRRINRLPLEVKRQLYQKLQEAAGI